MFPAQPNTFHPAMMTRGHLDQDQISYLLAPINMVRVYRAQSQSHVAYFDVLAHLHRIFGPSGWSIETLSCQLVHQRMIPAGDKEKWYVTYEVRMRLWIFNRRGELVTWMDDAATGSAQGLPTAAGAFDFALKNAHSYGLKRCAKNLGDQFGLSLYNKDGFDRQTGIYYPLVGNTLVWGPDAPALPTSEQPTAPAPDAHMVQVQSLGNDENEVPGVDPLTGEVLAPAQTAQQAPAPAPAQGNESLFDADAPQGAPTETAAPEAPPVLPTVRQAKTHVFEALTARGMERDAAIADVGKRWTSLGLPEDIEQVLTGDEVTTLMDLVTNLDAHLAS